MAGVIAGLTVGVGVGEGWKIEVLWALECGATKRPKVMNVETNPR